MKRSNQWLLSLFSLSVDGYLGYFECTKTDGMSRPIVRSEEKPHVVIIVILLRSSFSCYYQPSNREEREGTIRVLV